MQTFREKAEAWQGAAPQRAARRAEESALRRITGWITGLAVLALIGIVALAVLALVVAFVIYAAIHEWRGILFAMLVVVVAGMVVAQVREN